ncbi:iron-siderophore ABC transporter substrate-binding protein [Kitasatospora camelliae]|uniref:Iron-siderophore ABC transporter substrate-binding protein n=1 Tax=Kitasatospora camelliae TaxID=3156397 RepID=A0AAU8JYB9_9ACTN
MHPQLTRRTLLAGLGTLALGGCTGDPFGPRHRLPPVPSDGSPVPLPTPSVTVTAATGPVTVPGGATRVVALDTAELDSAMTLGITPVGAAKSALDSGLPGYWPASRLDAVAVVGDIGAEPDPYAIRAVRPHLILGNQTRDGAHHDLLQRLAPTVLTSGTGHPWKDNFRLHAAALSRTEQAEAVVTAYERHVAQTVRAIADAGSAGRRISILRFVDGTPGPASIRLYGRQNFIGTLLDDLGLGRPDPQNTDRPDTEITPAQIGQADGGDYLFYATYGDPEKAGTAAVLAGEAWKALGAVRAHRAFPVDDQLWFQGIGYTGANLVLAELQRALGG